MYILRMDVWASIVTLVVLIVYTLGNQECTDNSACEVLGDHFCYRGICSECYNCSIINRYASQTGCAESNNQCGGCLQGFEEGAITRTSTRKKPCRPIVEVSTESGDVGYEMHCKTDQVCPAGRFCYNQLCVSCLSCEHYKRHPSNLMCAKTPVDCGICLEGYEEILVTTTSIGRKPCQRIREVTPISFSPHVGSNVHITSAANVSMVYILIVSLACISAVVIIFTSLRRRQQLSSEPPAVNYSCSRNGELPPAYSPPLESSTSPSSCSGDATICGSYKEVQEVENTAKVLRPPCAGYYVGGDDESDLSLDDEATIPSTWTPLREGQRDEMDNNTQPLDFSFIRAVIQRPQTGLPSPTSCPNFSTVSEDAELRPQRSLSETPTSDQQGITREEDYPRHISKRRKV